MSGPYTEKGGLRWGVTYWLGSNATWPLASLCVTADEIRIQVKGFLGEEQFQFRAADINRLTLKRSLIGRLPCIGRFGTGLVVYHRRQEYPTFIMFWTLDADRLTRALSQRGYEVFRN